MNPEHEKYCVFSENIGEIRKLGKFEFKTGAFAEDNWTLIEKYSVRYDGGEWHEAKIRSHDWSNKSTKKKLSERTTVGSLEAVQGQPWKNVWRKPYVTLLHSNLQKFGGRTYIDRWSQKTPIKALIEEFEKETKKDFQDWRKQRKALKEAKIAAAAEEEGISFEEKKNAVKQHKNAVIGVEATNLKIKVLPEIDKIRQQLNDACDAIENNTFTAQQASDLRWAGKRLGGTGLGPSLRRLASLIRKRK